MYSVKVFVFWFFTKATNALKQIATEFDKHNNPQVDMYEKIYSEVESIGAVEVVDGWFRVDARPFKQALLNTTKRWSFMFKQHLIDHVTNRWVEEKVVCCSLPVFRLISVVKLVISKYFEFQMFLYLKYFYISMFSIYSKLVLHVQAAPHWSRDQQVWKSRLSVKHSVCLYTGFPFSYNPL